MSAEQVVALCWALALGALAAQLALGWLILRPRRPREIALGDARIVRRDGEIAVEPRKTTP